MQRRMNYDAMPQNVYTSRSSKQQFLYLKIDPNINGIYKYIFIRISKQYQSWINVLSRKPHSLLSYHTY